MEYHDYYKTLGLSRQATDADIKRAFRRLARKYHPDVNPGDAQADARFKEINEAHQVLSDPDKRSKYDRFGSNWRQTGSFEEAFRQSGGPGGIPAGGFGGTGFSDFFESLFGGIGFGGQRPPQTAKVDVEDRISVSLREVAEGGTRSLGVRTTGPDGQVREGRMEVRIPKGVHDGQRLRIAGQGGVRPDGSRGDLYLHVVVTPDPRFERDGDDLITTVDIGLTEAILGTEASVPTVNGRVLSVRIPPETTHGARLRLRGQGLNKGRSDERGDMLVRVQVRFPQRLSNRERSLFRELAEIRGERPLST